ncbi:hypothetical protein AVEN_137410-1 [Araneus ventricosus]|uniref:Uncharacterized protein n=1 Tax=Araneus ventricosus TaxID=182803 RepID=A0A4Y2A5K7_ARAVE|nr:hypothetical protein AVEN_137410-1 [Araneus ventricosus]
MEEVLVDENTATVGYGVLILQLMGQLAVVGLASEGFPGFPPSETQMGSAFLESPFGSHPAPIYWYLASPSAALNTF